MSISNIISLMGGLGAFLFGMKYMGDGLEMAAGAKMKDLLEKLTRNRVLGFLLGTLVFLLVALFAAQLDLRAQKPFRTFMCLYNIGLPLTAVMMLVRGVTQVLGMSLSTAASASISGIAGIGHILTGVGLVLLLVALRRAAKD